jgi:hypothetical protein
MDDLKVRRLKKELSDLLKANPMHAYKLEVVQAMVQTEPVEMRPAMAIVYAIRSFGDQWDALHRAYKISLRKQLERDLQ